MVGEKREEGKDLKLNIKRIEKYREMLNIVQTHDFLLPRYEMRNQNFLDYFTRFPHLHSHFPALIMKKIFPFVMII